MRGFALVMATMVLAQAAPALAKRSLPRIVNPVTAVGVTYSAPPSAMGFVVARDARDQREIWRERIYVVKVDRSLERDVQDVFITSLAMKGKALLIANERGGHYSLDLATRKVTRMSGRD